MGRRGANPRLDTEWRFLRLHAEAALALATGEFRTGRYIRGEDNGRWRREKT